MRSCPDTDIDTKFVPSSRRIPRHIRDLSIACSAKFEIARVKRRKTIKKMAENGATSTAPCLVFILYSTLID